MKSSAMAFALMSSVLAGCASNPSQVGINFLRANNYEAAYNVWKTCADQGDSYCINNLGTMYENGQVEGGRNTPKAAAYYSLAARYGLPIAQQNLMRLGYEIPAADLAAVVAQQQAVQQQQQTQNNQLASQLGYALGCAVAGGCGGPQRQSKQTTSQPSALKICRFDFDCGVNGVCINDSYNSQGVCGVR